MIRLEINPQVPIYGGQVIYGFKDKGTYAEFQQLVTEYLKMLIAGDTISSVFEDLATYNWRVWVYG